MTVIGLTGGSGSGKGYVGALFNEKGIPTIVSDDIVHDLYINCSDCISEIESVFGKTVIDKNGGIDRKALAGIVFSDRARIDMLNGIVHKYVVREIDRILDVYSKQGRIAAVIDAPLLYEANMASRCNFVISVVADAGTRIDRICLRDRISEKDAVARISNQHSDEFFIEHSDFVIYNNGEDLNKQIESILIAIGC